MALLRRWFSLQGAVSRRFYVLSGVGLMALKYAVDALMVWAVTGAWFSPLDYLNPVYALRTRALGPVPDWLFALMALWALPFLWIGLGLSVRRAATLGVSPWWGLGFAVPLLNYVVILGLSLFDSRAQAPVSSAPERARMPLPTPREVSLSPRLSGVLSGLAAGVGLTLGMTLVSAYWIGAYGSILFLTTPVVIGAAAAFLYNRAQLHSLASTLVVATGSVALGGLSLLLFAVEGIVCVAMALPLALVAAALGAALARWVVASGRRAGPGLAVLVLLLPLLAGVERWPARRERFEVASSIEVNAPPHVVFRHVVGFGDLPAPDAWIFRTGIAYPVRATIDGRGVGAIRRCVFSTGAFVEPITAWQEPTRLAFDVREQPPPMHEWSPYRHVHPPHLDGYLRSRRGEFRLRALAGGRTRLEGSTWYELDLAPRLYFAAWAHWAIHNIHMQVLEHVKRLAETQR